MTPTSLKLSVRGIGPVPAKKNSKLICRGMLITKPEYQRWMKACLDGFISQLSSATPTAAGATSTADSQRSWTSSLPSDDNWMVIPHIAVRGVLVPKGDEGADIELTPISSET